MRSHRLLIHCQRTSFCLYICSQNKAAHKKQNFEAVLSVVMYSPCSGGMNNSPCHIKGHCESDICRLVCFSSVFLLTGATKPCSHMSHCLLGASMETFAQKAEQKKKQFCNWHVNVLPFLPEERCTGNLLVFKHSDSFVNHRRWWSVESLSWQNCNCKLLTC